MKSKNLGKQMKLYITILNKLNTEDMYDKFSFICGLEDKMMMMILIIILHECKRGPDWEESMGGFGRKTMWCDKERRHTNSYTYTHTHTHIHTHTPHT
jgi:hypothetical protein